MLTPLRENDHLTEAQLRVALALLPAHHRFGAVLEAHAVLDSTSNVARALAEAGAPEGTTVVADQQTQGRGRQGRSWFSPPGASLYMSVILRPPVPPAQAPLLTLACAVAVVDALRPCFDEGHVLKPEDPRPSSAASSAEVPARPWPTVKWPNDILVGRRKICGILTEMASGRNGVDWVVVGIGVNVNLEASALPPDLASLASSLRIETGRTHDRAALCAAILAGLERESARLYVEGAPPMLRAWRARAGHLGKPVRYRQHDSLVEGTALDVDESGGLIVALPDGSRTTLLAGEIELP